jgi:large subunit ribosomal protein L10
MNKAQKAEIVEEIKQNLQNSTAVYLVDYRGINVADINQLRREFRKEGVKYKVYKNTLFARAIDEVGGYDKLKDLLVGMTGVVFAEENYVAPAKIIQKYFKETEKLALKGCYIESEFYDGSSLETLASMPTKEEVMAGIVGSIASPASGIVGALNAVVRDIVSLVDEISKQKAA